MTTWDPSVPVICRLCSDEKLVAELSRDADGYLTDVCLVCRQKELQAILVQVAAILEPHGQVVKVDPLASNETTQEVVMEKLPCGHVSTCWCFTCHFCEDIENGLA